MHPETTPRFHALAALGIVPGLRAALLVAVALACLVPAGCTTGPHPPSVVTPVRPDPKDGKDSSGRHPVSASTTGPHPGAGN